MLTYFKIPVLMEMFSWQHFVTLGCVLAIILVLFFTRKYFIKYKYLDLGFRITLCALMICLEIYGYPKRMPIITTFVDLLPPPLCGHIVWLALIVLLSNSSRLHKLIYPMAVTGALMSFIFLDTQANWPDAAMFQFTLVHGGFLITVLYFFFTKKSVKYSLKDLGYSCMLLASMAVVSMVIFYIKKSTGVTTPIDDPYYIMNPPGDLMPFREALGPVGYPLFFCFAIGLIQVIIWALTWVCTRKRDENDINYPYIKENKVLIWCDKFSAEFKRNALMVSILIFSFFTMIQYLMGDLISCIINFILFLLMLFICIFYEVLNNYHNQKLREEVKVEE